MAGQQKAILGAVVFATLTGSVAFEAVAVPFTINVSGPIKMKLSNYDEGTLYQTTGPGGTGNGTFVGEATLNALPQFAPAGGVAGEDGWGILRIDSISTDDIFETTLYNRFTAGFELTAIFYGLRDTYLNVTNAGLSTETQDIHGVGVSVAVFQDAAMNYNPSLGPTARPDAYHYPTVTDGDLLWTFFSTPGFDSNFPTDEFFTSFKPQFAGPGQASSSGGFVAEFGAIPFWGVGPGNNNFVHFAGVPDIEVNFTAESRGAAPWLLKSDDPIRAVSQIIPEPITASLSLLSMGALAMAALRRRKA